MSARRLARRTDASRLRNRALTPLLFLLTATSLRRKIPATLGCASFLPLPLLNGLRPWALLILSANARPLCLDCEVLYPVPNCVPMCVPMLSAILNPPISR
jgi:hypothetical protein